MLGASLVPQPLFFGILVRSSEPVSSQWLVLRRTTRIDAGQQGKSTNRLTTKQNVKHSNNSLRGSEAALDYRYLSAHCGFPSGLFKRIWASRLAKLKLPSRCDFTPVAETRIRVQTAQRATPVRAVAGRHQHPQLRQPARITSYDSPFCGLPFAERSEVPFLRRPPTVRRFRMKVARVMSLSGLLSSERSIFCK